MLGEKIKYKKILSLMIILFFGASMIISVSSTIVKKSNNTKTNNFNSLSTIIVPDDYPTIQEAINAALEGDLIYVRNGQYIENIVIDHKKNLIINGEDREHTIIDGNNYIDCFSIENCDKIFVSNFTIQNSGLDSHRDSVAGFFNSDNSVMSHCNLKNCVSWSFCLFYANNITLYDCQISNTKNGILLQDYNYNNTILNCSITSEIYGVNLLGNSSNNFIINNSIFSNKIGIILNSDTVTNNYIEKNNIEQNKLFGLLIKDATQNIIYKNTFIKNGLKIRFNAIDLNGNNQFFYMSEGNYWSDYFRLDLFPKDGIGDWSYSFLFNKDSYPLIKSPN